MGRRGQECRCCSGECKGCEKAPETLVVNLDYPAGEGVTFEADTKNDVPGWQAISTTCTVPAEKVGVEFFVTEQGDGYTSAPEVTLAGGGGELSNYSVTLQSPIVGIKVTDGGSGYSVAPSVTISKPSGGGQLSAAKAKAIVEGEVVSVTLTSPGAGYAEPPTVSLAGGQGAKVTAGMDGYLAAVSVTNGGEGYTSAPSVTLSGGGGSGAAATVFFSSKTGVVTGSFVTAGGSGYTSPPAVTITGGGGEGATAEATILFKIASLSLTAGGSGYPPNPEVRIEGSPGFGAEATAKISGSVVAVEVLDPGLYRYVKQKTFQSASPNWPSVTIFGPATAEPEFSGKVVSISTAISGVTNSGWTSEPTVTIAGGGGQGAAADAELTWARTQTRRFSFGTIRGGLGNKCLVNPREDFFMDQASELFPPVVPGSVQFVAESLAWGVLAVSSNDGSLGYSSLTFLFDQEVSQDFSSLYYFPGEAVWADVGRRWSTNGSDGGAELANVTKLSSTIVTHYAQRFFSRVAPSVVYRLSTPEQDPDDNVEVTPTFRQYVDGKEDSVWILEGLQITNAGTNLRTDPNSPTTVQLSPDGNAVEPFFTTVTFNFSTIQLALGPVEGFSVQPQLSFTTAPIGTTGFHSLTAASVTNGGQTDRPDGPVSLPVIVEQGHYDTVPNRPRSLNGTVTNGVLTGVTIPALFQRLIRPATLASIALPSQGLTTVGRSAFKTTRTHSQPTVTARATTVFPPQIDGAFAVALAQATDDNGEQYWYVDSVSVTQQGDGYDIFNPIIFEVEGEGIEAVSAVAFVVTDRDEPTQEPERSVIAANLNLIGNGADVTAVLSQQQTEFGDKFWEISSVTINNPGQGYLDGQRVDFFPFGNVAGGGGFGTLSVDQNGSIVAVNIVEKGQYFVPTNRAFRVSIVSGGKYYIRTTTPTSEPLPPVKCIGELTEENGWDIRPRRIINIDTSYEVGESVFRILPNGFDNSLAADSTRRCGLPEITLEWQ